jgi:arylsulfatase A-like enzyme
MNRSNRSAGLVVLLLASQLCAFAEAKNPADGHILPRPQVVFTGTLEPTEAASTAVFPVPFKAPQGAPNILLIMTDDVGFASASTFGGPVPTPNLDRLAAQGLRYNRFHTTGICSPTRAALLTGRNHHAVGTGIVVELESPYPGYTQRIPPSAATVARILRDNGYNTSMFGKDHNVPARERSPSGPFDQWPTGRGFEYFYGFVAGDTDQWQPALYRGISPVDGSNRPDDYILDKDLADQAIKWIHNQQAVTPDKPFFIYYAPGSAHAPHQAPVDWIARFRGVFDHGWDREREIILARQKQMGVVPPDTVLSARPEIIPAWDSLSPDEQKVYARYMEVYAAQLAYQDAQFGRLLDEIERMGIADNTLVVFIEGDNGSSAEGGIGGSMNELADLSAPDSGYGVDVQWLARNLDILGGPDSYQGYPAGWTLATSTPFPWFKQHGSHLGGVRNGLVVSWPARIEQPGGLRSQYHHVIDIMPTLLEAAQVAAPTAVDGVEQQPIDGKSMLYSFESPDAPSTRGTQYYEVAGNRGIYHDGWLASTTPRNMPWNIAKVRASSDVTTYPWELYDLRSDFSQSRNLAAQQPEKLQQLQAVFDTEARRNNVYPIQDSGGQARVMKMMMAAGTFTSEYVFWGPDIQLQMTVAPPIYSLPFSIEAQIEVPRQGGSGVIVAAGSYFSGWSFYLQDGKPVAYAAVSPLPLPGMQSRIEAPASLSAGAHTLRFDFDIEGEGGTLAISVDGAEVARGPVAKRPHILAGNGEFFDTGRDSNDPVSRDYQREGVFNGKINKVQVKLKMPAMSGAARAGNRH